MQAVIFDGHFGWLHPAAGQRGVVLCNPLGHEAMWLHKTMRRLAECLSARGLPVLRFDYLGTGDSLDRDGPVRPTDWPAEVVQAVNYLRGATSVKQVSLAGFRLGATIAAQAAQHLEIESIAMFAPVISANLFIREMKMLQQTWIQKTGTIVKADLPPLGACDILGHRFSTDALANLAPLDLRQSRLPSVKRLLMLSTGASGAHAELAARFTAGGTSVQTLELENFFDALQPAWLTKVPEAPLDAATEWFASGLSLFSGWNETAREKAPTMVLPAAIERPLHFDGGKVFGIHCEPVAKQARSKLPPVLVIANTAGTHHAGDGRFNVELARGLARAGYASLRIDADGIGDSGGAAAPGTPGLIQLNRVAADVSRAVDYLHARGYCDIAVFGICAGAYVGLRAAQDNAQIRGLVLVNPAGLIFPDGSTMQSAAQLSPGSPRAHFRSVIRARKWAKVIRGEIDLGPVMRRLCHHAAIRLQGAAAAWTGDVLFVKTHSHRVRTLLKKLDMRGVHIRLLISPHDHSLDELELHYGLRGRRLSKLKRVRAMIVANMDHELLNHAAREHVLGLCRSMLEDAFPPVQAQDPLMPTPESNDVSIAG